MDTARLRQLLDQRDAIDDEIGLTVNGMAKKERAAKTCSKCGSAEHNARSCTAQPSLPT